MSAQELIKKDYFTDQSLLLDPYEYFREMFAQGPVYPMAHANDVLLVTGFDEAVQILRNNIDFSSVISTSGAGEPLSFTPQGSDISVQLDAFSEQLGMLNLLVSYDGMQHTKMRSIASKLFTPTRLKATLDFVHEFADQLVQEAVSKGGCELVNEIATPFVTLVVAEILGVPPGDRDKFRAVIDAAPPAGNMNKQDASEQAEPQLSPLEYMGAFFFEYLSDRRENPREDVLTDLAMATYPDGELPDLLEMVKLSGFLFGAGQDTSAKLLSNAMRRIAEDPVLQQQLRDDYALIPSMLEEVLRLEGSTKVTFRIARRDTRVGDMDIPAGTRLTVALAAANRDPRRWEDPQEFRINRPRIKEHLAFGRGIHTCAGAPLARLEVAAILQHFFDHTKNISLCAKKHGPPGKRHMEYEPSYIIRGLANLYLDLEPR
jgi:cytochrome P450